jgi:hypothetical protein
MLSYLNTIYTHLPQCHGCHEFYLLGLFMIRLMYLGMIALPILVGYLGRNAAIRNLSILNHSNVADFSMITEGKESKEVQLKPYLIAGRNEKPDICMQLGSCKN